MSAIYPGDICTLHRNIRNEPFRSLWSDPSRDYVAVTNVTHGEIMLVLASFVKGKMYNYCDIWCMVLKDQRVGWISHSVLEVVS